MSLITLIDSPDSEPPRIVQLYEHLELFSEGEPACHTLFVLGRGSPLQVDRDVHLDVTQADLSQDQLLLIDPPINAAERFRLEGNVAVLFTGLPVDVGLPQMQTQSGGVAHIRVGQHFLDIYTQSHSTVVHLPAVGIICGGGFGSDMLLPQLAPGSDGSTELETLRLLARLIKQEHIQLYIPRVGEMHSDKVEIMQQLAADVAYLHSLRRVIPAAVERSIEWEELLTLGESLLPSTRKTSLAQDIHRANLQILANIQPD